MGGFGAWNKKSFGRNQQIQNPGRKSFNQRYMSPHRTYSGTVCSGTSIWSKTCRSHPSEINRKKSMNGRIFKISMKTGWNRKLSTTWKNWISQKRKSGWPITVNTFWKRSNMKMLRAGKSVLSLRKSVGRSTPWALKPTTTTSRNSSLKWKTNWKR